MNVFRLLSCTSIATIVALTPLSGAQAETRAANSVAAPQTEVHGVTHSDGTTVYQTGTSSLEVLPADGPAPSVAELEAMAASFTCSLNVQYPHGSSHVAGTINGVAVITCQIPAGSLTLLYSLARTSPNATEWGAAPKSAVNVRTLQNNKAVSCSQGPGQFRGWAEGKITPPPGYQLEGPASYDQWGSIVGVACGNARMAPDGVAAGGDTLELTFVRSDLVS